MTNLIKIVSMRRITHGMRHCVELTQAEEARQDEAPEKEAESDGELSILANRRLERLARRSVPDGLE